MISKVKSCGLLGIDGFVIEIETDIGSGLPSFDIVGLADIAVKESKERVKAAIKNSGLDFPVRKIIVNMAPANVKKEGSAYDLPIAIGILTSCGRIYSSPGYLESYMFIGELSLDGEVKPVNGILPMAICALYSGIENIILPAVNADEASVVKGINVYPAKNITEIIKHLNGIEEIKRHDVDIDGIFNAKAGYDLDFSDVKGQGSVKRALEVAASGSHNCLMIGSPGTGKTMLARRMPSIMPALTFEEALEVTKIHSIVGMLPPKTSLVTTRPFRSPHHTISAAGLVGGGKYPKPGEISLAHYGVLFLDEFPEFGKDALEVLRQPLEDGVITISRVNASITYPSRATLICAANPCKCGNFLDSSKKCSCTSKEIHQYLSRLSGPLLDRIDIQIEVASVKYSDLEDKSIGEESRKIRDRVNKVRKIQLERYKNYKIYSNSELSPSMINKFCRLDERGKELLRSAFERLGLSARAYNRILKVARTIADMDESTDIKPGHIAEAIQYRSLDRRFYSN